MKTINNTIFIAFLCTLDFKEGCEVIEFLCSLVFSIKLVDSLIYCSINSIFSSFRLNFAFLFITFIRKKDFFFPYYITRENIFYLINNKKIKTQTFENNHSVFLNSLRLEKSNLVMLNLNKKN